MVRGICVVLVAAAVALGCDSDGGGAALAPGQCIKIEGEERLLVDCGREDPPLACEVLPWAVTCKTVASDTCRVEMCRDVESCWNPIRTTPEAEDGCADVAGVPANDIYSIPELSPSDG